MAIPEKRLQLESYLERVQRVQTELAELSTWLNTTKDLLSTTHGHVDSVTSSEEQDSVVVDRRVRRLYSSHISASTLRSFAKLKQFKQSQIQLDRAHPIHPPLIHIFFGNPSLTLTEHSNHNHYWFLAILGRFSIKENPRDLDPTTHFLS